MFVELKALNKKLLRPECGAVNTNQTAIQRNKVAIGSSATFDWRIFVGQKRDRL
jgi:hypothetical protein